MKRILIFTHYYLPGFKAGGPIRSINNLVEWLGDEYDFGIITSDRDLSDKYPYEEIKQNEWNKVGKAQVYYIKKEKVNFKSIIYLLKNTEFDVVYFNSFFDFWYTLVPLFILKYILRIDVSKIILIPRGELSAGALRIKNYKKKLFLWGTRVLGFFEGIFWQATNEDEKNQIQANLKINPQNILISSNLPLKITKLKTNFVQKEIGSITLVYLSRITPKKNLLFAIDLLEDINGFDVKLDIYGLIDDDSYWRKCEKRIDKLPSNVKVSYCGSIEHDDVIPTLSKYHIFIMPTFGENYGHAIFESITAGTPILISNKTPWLNLEENKVGWSLSLNAKEEFISAILSIINMNQENYNKFRLSVTEYFKKIERDQTLKTVEEANKMFQSLV